MNSPAKAHEPTMEEILASIRRIISDDDPVAADAGNAASAAAPAPELRRDAQPERVGQDDIDAMLAELDAPASSEKSGIAPQNSIQDDLEVLELTEEMEDIAEPAQEPAPPPKAQPLRPVPSAFSKPAAISEDLLSAAVGEQVSNAFGTLAHTVLAGNAKTLDDIVREMLRPMLRAWLDDNLPPLVERLVRQEIERVARGGR